MTTPEIALLMSFANFVLTWGVALYMYLANKNKATNERIGSLEKNIDEKLDDYGQRIVSMEATAAAFDSGACPKHGERLSGLEKAVASAPSHNDLAAIHTKINVVAQEVSKMSGHLESVSDNLRLILTRITEKGMR